jgi:Protein of unknown function (DUF5818)
MRYLMLVSLLLLGVSWAVAQNDSTPASSPQSHASQTATGGSTTVQGCLSGSDGSYTLTDKDGKTYQLTGDTAKLSEHVGHEIRVTGEANASSGMGTNSAAGQTSTGSETISVSTVKHISKTCKNAMSK